MQLTCPACERGQRQTLSLMTYRKYRLYHCDECDLQYWYPRDNLDSSYYESSKIYAEHHLGTGQIQKWHKPFFRRFPFRTGTLLDIGCGDGAFLEATRRLGFDSSGVDLDRHAVNAARERVGIDKVYPMHLSEYVRVHNDGGGKQFDVVTFFEVMEHQEDLKGFIRSVRALLRDGGRIAGSVPNRDRLIVRRESTDYPPNHYLYWSRLALESFLLKEGFSDVVIWEHAGLEDSAIYIETQLLGELGIGLKSYLKSRHIGERSKIPADTVSVNTLKQLSGRRLILLPLMRMLRTSVFIVPAMLLYPWIRSQIYFQAEK